VPGARAQLSVQRSGQLDWLRRSVGELWTLQPETVGAGKTSWSAQRTDFGVLPGSWLAAAPDGRPRLAQAPVREGDLPLIIALWHPRTGAWVLGTESTLEERPSGRVHVLAHTLGVAAMTLSSDQRRLYFVSPRGELFVLPVMPLGLDDAPTSPDEPERLLGDLDLHGEPCGLALGPAGLVLATSRAVLGINLRSRTVAPIVAELAAHTACAPLRAPAVAMDHRRNLFLADEHAVVCAPGHGTPPYVCARP
jgi:hypothetical protein